MQSPGAIADRGELMQAIVAVIAPGPGRQDRGRAAGAARGAAPTRSAPDAYADNAADRVKKIDALVAG